MKTGVLSVVTLLIVSFSPVFATGDTLSTADLLSQINSKRVTSAQLALNDTLMTTAQYKCDDLILNDYYAHIAPGGETFKNILDKAGYNYRRAAENITINYKTASGAVTSWMNSTAHREEMLNEVYTEAGIASSSGKLNGADVTVICAHFGNESAAPIPTKGEVILKQILSRIGNISIIR